ncbi:hypothetical protein SAY87_030688 [Trapa incisa]|uniref:Peroxisomal and mitochondrial division factor 2-like n=1 Tax=Trapa incisa TaxID=236973 RepID=A0AAN7KMW0_9MYRT|nr:hypothetical protein SAY87_030688 [Trapa incisa]
MADEAAINDVVDQDFFDTGNEDKVNELAQKLKSLELERAGLVRGSDENNERIRELLDEIERLKSEEASRRDKFERMEREIELAEDGERAMESIAKRAVELETEVARLQHDLISVTSEGEEASKELAELRTVVEEKGQKVEVLELELENLKTGRAEGEMKVRDLERKIGVLEVKEIEGKSDKLRLERELMENIGEKEKVITELKEKMESLEVIARREALKLEKLKKEKSDMDVALRESEKKCKDMESKLHDLQGELERAEKVIGQLKETSMDTINGTVGGLREIIDVGSKGSKVQWPLLAVGSTGTVAVVAALAYICYAKHVRN